MNEPLQLTTGGAETQPAVRLSVVPASDNGDWARSVGRVIDDLRLAGFAAPSFDPNDVARNLKGNEPMFLALLVVRGNPARAEPPCHRPVLTLLFVDIVQSTRRAEEMGDALWRGALDAYRSVVRRAVGTDGGREIDHAGDGFFAAFDRPAQAICCAQAIRDGVGALGLEVRVGLHSGECELTADGVAGVAVHIAARVAAKARAGEILVSRTVKDLVCGSSVQFSPAKRSVLKGLSHEFRLFALNVGTGHGMVCA
jgi:class 3 adenylate cyclase